MAKISVDAIMTLLTKKLAVGDLDNASKQTPDIKRKLTKVFARAKDGQKGIVLVEHQKTYSFLK